jgi:putative endonuclease
MMKNQYYIYIMTNIARTLYTGVTNDLEKRVYVHKMKLVPGFTTRYNLTTLVYFESGEDINAAIYREKQIKGWRRNKKIALIESLNPEWKDLSEEWFDCHSEGVQRPKNPSYFGKGTDSSLRSELNECF